MRGVVVVRRPLRCRFRKPGLFTLLRGPERSFVIGRCSVLPGKGIYSIPAPRASLMYLQFILCRGLRIGNPAPLCALPALVRQ